MGRIVDSGTLDDLLACAGCRNLTDAFLYNVGLARQQGAGS